MAVYDDAQVKKMVAEAVEKALAAAATHMGKSEHIHKHFTRLEKFDGGNGDKWKEWYYQFGVATSSYNIKNGMLLEILEKKEVEEVTTENIELEMSKGSPTGCMRRRRRCSGS